MTMPLPKCNKGLQSFMGIVNSLSKFSPMTAVVCNFLRKPTLVKTEWAWNGMCQDLYSKAKDIIKHDACMKFYDASKPYTWTQTPCVLA